MEKPFLSSLVRMGAGYALAEIGPDAGDAVPALQEAAKLV